MSSAAISRTRDLKKRNNYKAKFKMSLQIVPRTKCERAATKKIERKVPKLFENIEFSELT